MRIHLTCSRPQRRLVIAMHAARNLLLAVGHQVTVSWPETWEDAEGRPQLGYNRAALASADVVVHAALDDEALPPELADARAGGRLVVRYVPQSGSGDGAVPSAREVVDAVANAWSASVT